MPAKNAVKITVEVEGYQLAYLKKIAEEFSLPDESKALRVLLDYALQDGDDYQIFANENMRCRHCV